MPDDLADRDPAWVAAQLEEIRQLKARYCRLLDTRRWSEWADVFTDDVQMRYGPAEDAVVTGVERVVELATNRFAHATTVHCAYMPEIVLDGPAEAHGTWAMFDDVEFSELTPAQVAAGDPDVFLGRRRGYGHYEERYRRGDDGRWRIAVVRLIRLRLDRVPRTASRDETDQPLPFDPTGER